MATSLLRRIRQELTSTTPWLPLGAWLLLMVLIPVAQWSAGDRGFVALTVAGVLTQLSAVVAVLASRWRALKIIRVLLVIPLIGWLIELIGIQSGFPFGAYVYSERLQPKVGGVPLLIPLAWLMMTPPAWAIASRIISPRKRVAFALVSGLAFTVWDFYLDPQMVSNGIWAWDQPGIYFGVPLTNFLGWWFASVLISLAAAPADLYIIFDDTLARSLALIYTLTWLLQAGGLAFIWDLPLPALCGFIGMGFFVLLFWRAELRR